MTPPTATMGWNTGLLFSLALLFVPIWSEAGSDLPGTTGSRKYWVYFRDKGPEYVVIDTKGGSIPRTTGRSVAVAEAPELTPRALRRRARTMGSDDVISPEDLPLYRRYIEQIENLGARVSVQSRWMNAVSAWLTPGQAEAITGLGCVDRISPVRTLGVRRGPGTDTESRPWMMTAPDALIARETPVPDYGNSFAQLDAVRVPQLHAIGVTGRDVVIGLLDSGFRWREHRSLADMAVIGEHDFISDDDNTGNQPGDPPGQDFHGTLVLSVVGGYAPGALVGPAFGSEFLLAKTEVIGSETQVEEDNWAAGIEWLEAMGVDVVNSSLGYDVWDDGSGYSWAGGDFDGKTTVVAKAAARAARLGVILCISAGNEGNGDGITGTLLTPADVDTAITAGAASIDGLLAGSSSTGPTSDARIKPDLSAPGIGVFSASASGYDSYTFQNGTSMASPFAAGAAALLLSVRPELTPVQVREILRSSADTSRIQNFTMFPNNFTGWGYVDALGAALSQGPVFSNRPVLDTSGAEVRITIDILSKYGLDPGEIRIGFRLEGETTDSGVFHVKPMMQDSSFMFPTSGRYSATITGYPVGTTVAFFIEAGDSAGHAYRSPPPPVAEHWVFTYGSTDVEKPIEIPTTFQLLQNYPNPFNGTTNIVFDLPEDGAVSVKIFNVLGQLVLTLFDGFQAGGSAESRAPLLFRSEDVPGGAYFCRVTTSRESRVIKMMVVK